MSALQKKKWLDTGDVERTEVLYDFQDILACALDIAPKINKTHDLCLGKWGPSVILGTEVVKNAFIAVHNRGAKIRLITEISIANITHCKEFMKFAEVRHLDKVEGHFSVSDTKWYTASAVAEKDKPPPRLIYSTVKEIAEQHQYFFETLWNKAIPAEQKIREIEEGIEPVYTIVLDSPNEISNKMRKTIQGSTEIMICAPGGGLEFVYSNLLDEYRDVLRNRKEGKHKGIRWVTQVTKENLDLVKVFVNEGIEIRHVRNMPPLNFGIYDNALHATIESMEGGRLAGNFLVSTEPAYLKHFRSIFDQLWKQGTDGQDRILELEKETEPANVEIISNPRASVERAWDLIRSAKRDVMVMLSSPTAFRRQMAMGGLEVIEQAVKNGARVKLLIPSDRNVAHTLNQVKSVLPSAEFRAMDASLTTSITIILVDSKQCMFFELKDDMATESYQAVGLALYSNSMSIVSSYSAILEAIWKQSELNEQIRQANEKLEDAYSRLEAHEVAQKEFINVAAHELRTPIQPLLGITELIQQNTDGKNKVEITKEELDMLVRNARRLERLSSDILDVSRIEGQCLQLNKESVNLNENIENVLKDVKSFVADHKQIETMFDSNTAEPVLIEADKGRLFQVLSNLLKNAIKFTSEGTIRVTLEERDGQAMVQVIDTGRGIDSEIFPKLFTKFVTKSDQGTGLGLYLSKGIIEAHGGKIWAENNKNGKGATFIFTLPLEQ
ncbi:MAG TPA: ATP-binding protein [Nitrososphaera sp.]|jgi:signal transduction histidine kinase|nr:ATP-binding protein [Nitrososphaera sp.]